MFRDNLQNPQRTAMQSLRDLDDLTKLSMSSGDYANMAFGGLVNNMMDPSDTMRYLESGGIVGLPVVQAGLGGFLKKITSIPKAIARGAKRFAKSDIGRLAIAVAPAFVGLPPVFANPALNAAFFSGTTSLLTGAKPKDALKSAVLSGALTGVTQGFRTPVKGSEGLAKLPQGAKAARFEKAIADKAAQDAVQKTAETNIFKDLLRGATDKTYDPEGTGLGRILDRISGTGQFEGTGLGEQLGFQPGTAEAQAQESLQTFDATGTTPAGVDVSADSYDDVVRAGTPKFEGQTFGADVFTPGKTDIDIAASGREAGLTGINTASAPQMTTYGGDVGTMQYPGGTASTLDTAAKGLSLDSITGALRKGVELAASKPKTTAAILAGAALLGSEQDIPQSDLDMAGITKETVDTDFDKQRFVYRDAQGNPLTTAQALQMIQTASQGFGAGGQRMASGVRGAFERVDPVLSASGGLIGMAYGGSMPMNNMDVKYKEFSGMVGGRGDGMEDNVYMPIVEGESGQQVATLAVSPKEYVVDANTMSLLGNGNPDEGAEIMDQTVKDVRKKATGQTKQQKEIDGLAALNRMRRSV